MPPVPNSRPSATGLGNARNRRKGGNRRKPTQLKKSQMKNVVLSLKDTKKHSSTVSNFTLWTANAPWVVIKPLNVDISSSNSEVQRESNMIYALNTRLDLTITTNPVTLQPYHLRILKGYAKGDSTYGQANGTRMPNDQLSEANMNTAIPQHYTEIDSDDFKILFDKTYTLAPRQIYDSATATEQAGENRAVWKEFKFKHNWKFDRKMKYEDAYGSSLVGWVPFIAIQVDRSIYGEAFTGTAGSHPSPTVQYNMDTYFKDIN